MMRIGSDRGSFLKQVCILRLVTHHVKGGREEVVCSIETRVAKRQFSLNGKKQQHKSYISARDNPIVIGP